MNIRPLSTNCHGIDTIIFFSNIPIFLAKKAFFNPPLAASRLVTFHQNLFWIVVQIIYRHLTNLHQPPDTRQPIYLALFPFHPFPSIPAFLFIIYQLLTFFPINQHTFTEYKVLPLDHGDFMFQNLPFLHRGHGLVIIFKIG